MMGKKNIQRSSRMMLFTDCEVSRKPKQLFSHICSLIGLSAFSGHTFCQK